MVMPNLKRQWTVADRDELPDDGNRYEVIDGELFVTPAPAWRHQDAVGELYAHIAEYLRREPIGHAVMAPADVVFSPTRGVQPDLFVVPLVGGRKPRHFDDVRRVLLAVEVLSPSTARADRVNKRTLYHEEQVREYWIVDLDSRIVERSTPSEPRPEILDSRLVWLPDGATNPLAIDLAAYFEKVLEI
jgi:Uma2 family endonuclease